MAQYDVYAGRGGALFLDVQSDLIDGLSTRIVIPLIPTGAGPRKIKRLHPVLSVDGKDYMLATNLLAAVQKTQLGASKANLLARHDDIAKAIYMLFQGF